MSQLVERLKSEKTAMANEDARRHHREAEGRRLANSCGKGVAKKWIKSASYQEIKDAVGIGDAQRDANCIGLMRNTLFKSIDRICPEEAQQYKWIYNDAFMDGWREEVIIIWESMKNEVDGGPIHTAR